MINLLKNGPEVLILGTNSQTTELIKLLNKKYNIIPILFASRHPTLKIFSSARYIFCHQKLLNNNYYITHAILDIAKSLRGDCRALLPCTSHFENIIAGDYDFFENEYIIYKYIDIQKLLTNQTNSK